MNWLWSMSDHERGMLFVQAGLFGAFGVIGIVSLVRGCFCRKGKQ
jgi:hypothetical protein